MFEFLARYLNEHYKNQVLWPHSIEVHLETYGILFYAFYGFKDSNDYQIKFINFNILKIQKKILR